MKISYNWLKEILQFDLSPQELAEALTGAGFPVEEISSLTQELDGVIVAELLEVNQHPNADRLSLTKVSDGTNVFDVVCGARNIAAGDKVPFAGIGTVLPGDFKIKKAKIRGEVSEGMLCSADELRLDIAQNSDGILQLPKDSKPGQGLVEYLGLDDVILDIELTANRSDLLSVRGLTAEIAAILGKSFTLPLPPAPECQDYDFPISLETEACPRYTGRVIKGVKVGPSPLWLQLRLLACGMRPVNNIVDITNMVMLEWGQPLHAFDADKLPQLQIGMRQARPGETMVTLDDKERKLEPHMMLVTSGDKPVAIAGVMGSLDSEVDENTTNVLLESADFDSLSVRLTGKALGLASEAASRFEKGVDPAVVLPASDRAGALISEIAGGSIGKLVDAGRDGSTSWTVDVDLTRVNNLLGADVPQAQAVGYLENLGLEVREAGSDLTIRVDGRRPDLRIWEDIAEEVGRLYGLDNIPASLPAGALTQGRRRPDQVLEWQIREILVGSGLHEIVPYSFISPEMAQKCQSAQGVPISNPLTRERSLMRGDMLASVLEAVSHNMAHGRQGIAVFEVGNVYRPEAGKELPVQAARVAGALAGDAPIHWQQTQTYDFYSCKGVVEQLLAGLDIEARFERGKEGQFHPGRCAAVYAGEALLGHVGQVHPSICANLKLELPIWFFDLDFQALAAASTGVISFSAPSRYPAIQRDLALETDVSTPGDDLAKIIRLAGGQLLEKVECFDVYSGPNLGPDRKSLAFALSFRHPQRTLQDKEVQTLVDDMVRGLEEVGAKLRQ